MYRYLFPILAFLGALAGLFIVFWSHKAAPTPPILFPPPKSPYAHAISAAGIIEASSQNIAVGSPFNEIATHIYVVEGDVVKKGDPLFQLDTRAFDSEKEAALASLREAEVSYQDKKEQFSYYERLHDKRAVSEQIFEQTRFAMLEAEQNVFIAKANVQEVETNIERSTIRAPIDGVILQVNLHPGELAPILPIPAPLSPASIAQSGVLLLMGSIDPLQMRINIDEEDCWRFERGARATAFVRGNSSLQFPMKFLTIEPYIIPKNNFTGAAVERIDTRVLQVLYRFDKGDLPIYVGQILDVFVEAKPIESFIKR